MVDATLRSIKSFVCDRALWKIRTFVEGYRRVQAILPLQPCPAYVRQGSRYCPTTTGITSDSYCFRNTVAGGACRAIGDLGLSQAIVKKLDTPNRSSIRDEKHPRVRRVSDRLM